MVGAPAKNSRFDIVGWIREKLARVLKDGDAVVVSSRFIAISQGWVVARGGSAQAIADDLNLAA